MLRPLPFIDQDRSMDRSPGFILIVDQTFFLNVFNRSNSLSNPYIYDIRSDQMRDALMPSSLVKNALGSDYQAKLAKEQAQPAARPQEQPQQAMSDQDRELLEDLQISGCLHQDHRMWWRRV